MAAVCLAGAGLLKSTPAPFGTETKDIGNHSGSDQRRHEQETLEILTGLLMASGPKVERAMVQV